MPLPEGFILEIPTQQPNLPSGFVLEPSTPDGFVLESDITDTTAETESLFTRFGKHIINTLPQIAKESFYGVGGGKIMSIPAAYMLSRKAKERGVDLGFRDAQKLIKGGVLNKLGETIPEFDIPTPETFGEKATDVAAGITKFAAELYALKKIMPGTSDRAIWEMQNLVSGGTPGQGALMHTAFSIPGKVIPGTSKLARTGRLAAESAMLGGMTAAEQKITTGEIDWAAVAISAGIPPALRSLGYVQSRIRARDPKVLKAIQDVSKKAPVEKKPELKVPQEIDSTVRAINEWIPTAEKIKKAEWQPAVKKLRAQQITGGNKVLNIAKKKGVNAEEAMRSAQKGFKVKAIRPEVEPPKLTGTQWNSISAKAMDVYSTKADIFKLSNLQRSLDNLRYYKKIPTNYEFGLLEPVLGTPTIQKMYAQLAAQRTYGLWDVPVLMRDGFKSKFGYDPQSARSLTLLAARHPRMYFDAIWKNLVGYLGGKERANRLIQQVEADPAWKAGKKLGVNYLGMKPWTATHEAGTKLQQYGMWTDFLLSRKNRILRKWGEVFAASERGASIGINSAMESLTNQALRQAEAMRGKGYIQPQIDKFLKKRISIINTFTKRVQAKHPKAKEIQRAANWFLFSPAYTVARPKGTIQAITNLFAGGPGNRLYGAELVLSNIAAIAGMGSMAAYVGNKYRIKDPTKEPLIDGSYSPTNSLWGKVRSGNDVIDLSFGEASWYRLLARLGVSAHQYAKQQLTGEYQPKRGRGAGEELLSYLQSRETVLIGLLKTLATGKDWIGNDIGRTEALLKQIPFEALISIVEAGEADGMWEALSEGDGSEAIKDFIGNTPIGVMGLAGIGTLSYTVNPASTRAKFRETMANQEYDKDWDSLNRLEQARLKMKYRNEFTTLDEQVAEDRAKDPFNPQRIKDEEKRAGKYVRSKLNKANQKKVEGISTNVGRSPRGFYLNDKRYSKYLDLMSQNLDERLSRLEIREGLRSELKRAILESAVSYAKAKAFAELQQEEMK